MFLKYFFNSLQSRIRKLKTMILSDGAVFNDVVATLFQSGPVSNFHANKKPLCLLASHTTYLALLPPS